MQPRAKTSDATAVGAPPKRALEVTVGFGDVVLDIRHVLPPKGLVIGEGKAADLFVSSDGLPASEFPLVRSEQGRFVLTFTNDQRGEIQVGMTIHPLQWFHTHKGVETDPLLEGCYRYVLPEDAVVTLRFDGMSIVLRHVTAPERLVEPPTKRDLRYGALLLGGSLSVLVALLLLSVIGSAPEQMTPLDAPAVEMRTARLLMSAPAGTVEGTRAAPARSLSRTPLVLGVLSSADAENALAPKQDAVAACLEKDSEASAKITVDADGTSFVEAVSGADCLYDVLSGMRFVPPLDGRAEVELFLRGQ